MSNFIFPALLVVAVSLSEALRPSYAGHRPIGYPQLADRFQEPEQRPVYDNMFDGSLLDNRFGESYEPQRIPVDAQGDLYLLQMLNTYREDQKPFWLLNYQQIEANRGGAPIYSYIPAYDNSLPNDTGFMTG